MKKRWRVVLLLGLALILSSGFLIARAYGPRTKGLPRAKLIQGADSTASQSQTATLLPDGRTLLLGGQAPDGPSATAAIQDPQTGTVIPLPGRLQHPRAWHSATMVPDGTVLILGGIGADGHVVDVVESFDPATQTFKVLPSTALSPRAYHTATLLTEGRVLVAGGVADNGATLDTAQLWDPRSGVATDLPTGLLNARRSHTATLLSDGTVLLWGGTDRNGTALSYGEIYDPATQRFRLEASRPAAFVKGQQPQLQVSLPDDGAANVPVNTLIAMRFSEPLRVQTVNSNTVTLSRPQGSVSAKVIPAEGGMLAFVTPDQNLLSGTTYTLNSAGPTDLSTLPLPDTTFSFTTAGQSAGGASGVLGGAESWPGGPQDSPWRKLPPLEAPPGVTAISGQVLLLDGHPLANVTLRAGSNSAETDRTGRFLLRGLSGGHVAMIIDGRTASHKQATYGVFKGGLDVTTGRTNVLKYTIWMPQIDTARAVTLPVPTTSEVVVTTPLIPGLEFHIPAATTITDIDGKVTNQVSITPIPITQPPFPLPPGVNVPVYFTIQPGGGYLSVTNSSGPKGARLVYPNSFHETAGSRFDFWNYDAEQKGWYVYGHGTVSSDGKSVVPDPGVLIYELSGAMVGGSGQGPSTGPPGGPKRGEPVDLATGLFVYEKTDLYVTDVIPIQLARTYRPNDGASRAFGVGATHDYDIFLIGDIFPYTYLDLIMPDGGRIHYPRVSTGTNFTDAVYQCNSRPGPFFASTIIWNGSGWTLTLRDGMVYKFPDGFGSTRGQQGALLSVTDRNGNVLTVTRDSNANITQITSPNGRWIQFTYDSNFRVTQAQDNIGRTVQYFYDSSGRLNKVIDANGGTWLYNYDSSNNMTSVVDARNITYIQNQYDSQNRVIKQTLADNVSTYQFAYNPSPCTSNCSGIWETDVTDPNGTVEKVTFNPAPIFSNGFTTGGYPSTITRAAGTSVPQTFSYQYQPGTSLLASFTDALNRTTSLAYDPLGNETSTTRLAGTSNAVTTSLTYEAKFSQTTSVTDPLSHTTAFTYDAKGNLISVSDPLGNTSAFAYNAEGQLVSTADPLGETTNFAYDGGDLTSIMAPLGRSVTFFYDSAGRQISRTNALGQFTKYSYNALNQITQIIDPMGGVTSFSYDPNGNLLSVTDPRNTQNPTTYTYDNMDRVATRKDPLGNQESYQYDGNGNLTQFTDRRGKITTYTYDSLNRRSFAGFGRQVGPTYESTIGYSFDGGNRLTSAIDSITGTITRGFDGLDRSTSETSPQGSISYTYDAAGRRATMTVAGQSAVNYNFDNADRLTQITQGTSAVQFAYDGVSRRTSLTLPNGVVVSYGYDIASDLTGINYQLGLNTLGNLAYAYDLAGRRVQAGGSFARTGLPQAVTTTAYNAANQLTQWGTATPTYDANGNTLSDGTNTYVWNARNQLASMNSSGETFQYDPFGRRVSKKIVTASTNYLYDGVNPVQELSATTPTANLLTGGTDEYFTRADGAGARSFLTDALGSTLGLTDTTGTIQTQYTFDPFGNTTASGASSTNSYEYTGRENDGTGVYFYRARYYSPTLQRLISEDPLLLGNAALVPEFRSPSTASRVNPPLPQPYSYANDNPVSYADPSGLQFYPPVPITTPVPPFPPSPRLPELPPPTPCNNTCSQYPSGSLLGWVCQHGGDNPWSNCVRECLKEHYEQCSAFGCIIRDHIQCWLACPGGDGGLVI
jgi:RHS repeat-associated protein